MGLQMTVPNSMRWALMLLVGVLLTGSISGCETTEKRAPLKLVDHVDIPRFMGKWFVVANIPTFIEKGAHNATESYELANDGSIDIKFRFNKDSFDGPVKEYHPRGFIYDKKSNAEWRVRFIWPFLADYLVIDLASDYSWTVIGVPSRSYLWIMARSPKIEEKTYSGIIERLSAQGYDTSKIETIPHR
jgi:apolipoprotein D and lipocalin family protein